MIEVDSSGLMQLSRPSHAVFRHCRHLPDTVATDALALTRLILFFQHRRSPVQLVDCDAISTAPLQRTFLLIYPSRSSLLLALRAIHTNPSLVPF